jgi:hypothetical protein
MNKDLEIWPSRKKIAFLFFFLYILIFACSFSFPHPFIPDFGKFLSPLFEKWSSFTGKHIFNLSGNENYALESDTAGLYLHAFNLVFIVAILSALIFFTDRKRKNYLNIQWWFFVFLRYFLALHLLSYGCDKIFKAQFYFPEPNTLFTTVGETPKDLLYWSTMGSSRGYNLFLGSIEVIAALLLFSRTASLAGALLSLAIFINVLAVNLCFDISVKLFSSFLILICLLLISNDYKKLFSFFFGKNSPQAEKWQPSFLSKPSFKFPHIILKCGIILLFILSATHPYTSTGNFNDDKAPRPFLHGAYAVSLFVKNGDTIAPDLRNVSRWKRAFVHRRGFFIVQNMNDELLDYELKYDSANSKLHLFNYADSLSAQLNYSLRSDSSMILRGDFFGDTLLLHLKKLDLKNLWLLQDEFEWTVKKEDRK